MSLWDIFAIAVVRPILKGESSSLSRANIYDSLYYLVYAIGLPEIYTRLENEVLELYSSHTMWEDSYRTYKRIVAEFGAVFTCLDRFSAMYVAPPVAVVLCRLYRTHISPLIPHILQTLVDTIDEYRLTGDNIPTDTFILWHDFATDSMLTDLCLNTTLSQRVCIRSSEWYVARMVELECRAQTICATSSELIHLYTSILSRERVIASLLDIRITHDHFSRCLANVDYIHFHTYVLGLFRATLRARGDIDELTSVFHNGAPVDPRYVNVFYAELVIALDHASTDIVALGQVYKYYYKYVAHRSFGRKNAFVAVFKRGAQTIDSHVLAQHLVDHIVTWKRGGPDTIRGVYTFFVDRQHFEMVYLKHIHTLLLGPTIVGSNASHILESIENLVCIVQVFKSVATPIFVRALEDVVSTLRVYLTTPHNGIMTILCYNTRYHQHVHAHGSLQHVAHRGVRMWDRHYQAIYAKRNKTLHWRLDLGSADVQVRFSTSVARVFRMHTYQTLFLLAMPPNGTCTYEELVVKLNMPPTDALARQVIALCHPSIGILHKTPNTPALYLTDTFAFNSSYSKPQQAAPLTLIPIYLGRVPDEEHARLYRYRLNYQVDAAIVKIMKREKSVAHTDLVALTCPHTALELVRDRIHALLAIGYIERSAEDRNVYNYLP